MINQFEKIKFNIIIHILIIKYLFTIVKIFTTNLKEVPQILFFFAKNVHLCTVIKVLHSTPV